MPSLAAGAVIGKGGETITQIQKEYGANIKMSKSQDFYPGKYFYEVDYWGKKLAVKVSITL